ncbi:26392_t:CDS:2, partial [Racocetra persica]
MLKKKRYNNESSAKKKVCAIGSCVVGDEKAYNACGKEENKPRFSKLVLSDIAIHLVLTSVHTGQIKNLIRIVPWAIDPPDRDKDSKELDVTGSMIKHYKVPVAGSKTLLTSLIQKMRLHFFLVRICDKDLARKIQNDITPKEIFIDSKKLDDPELKDYFQILAKYYREINCDQTGCLLKDWNFYICYQFSKDEQKVCMLPEEDDTDSIIFDTTNFVLILVVDYIPRFFKIRRLRNKILPPDTQNPNQQDPRYLTNNN